MGGERAATTGALGDLWLTDEGSYSPSPPLPPP